MNPRWRAILLRLARPLAVATALLVPWPGVGQAYAAAFGAVATTMVRPFFAGRAVTLTLTGSSATARPREWSVMVHVDDAATGNPKSLGAVDVHRAGYLQIAFFLVSAAAFPLADRRLLVPVLLGGMALLAMLGWLPILMYLAVKHVIGLGMVSFSVLAVIQRSLTGAPGMAIALPGLLWLFVLRMEHRPASNRDGASTRVEPRARTP